MKNKVADYKFKDHRLSFFLTFMVIALSGNPILRIYNVEMIYILLSAILILIAARMKLLQIYSSSIFTLTISILLGLFIVQFMDTRYDQSKAAIGFILKILVIYSTLRLVKGFEFIFIKLMYYISLVSLAFFGLHFIYPQIADFGVTIIGENDTYFYHKSLYVYTFLIDGLNLRNSGMFSEPGLFAGSINIAVILLLPIKKQIPKKLYNRYLLVFFITILSTSSTQGYLVFGAISFYMLYGKINDSFNMSQSKRVATIFGLIILFLILKYAFEEIPFLYQKIQGQSALVSNEERNFEITRWGGFLTSLQYIYQKPLWGWGIDVISAINSRQSQKIISSGTGMTDIIMKLGVPFFIFLGYKVYHGFSLMYQSKTVALFFLVVFLLLIQGEPFFNFPMIYIFYFLGFKKKTKVKLKGENGPEKMIRNDLRRYTSI